ncbi:hypothetical protein THRCLA_07502 [Thraustotheca clavata]|uniref:Kazal-like domain-containing protein n=1 Tax=Thraustotheca clavata TaxID=74557 RepID=A0A1V9ZD48_9STRA|nr:hypothetical protein THRCLA_07502 [Thraustotheca clavata]
MASSLLRLIALVSFVGSGLASDMQAASCAAKCPPLKQNYCAIDGLLPTYSKAYTSQCTCDLKCLKKIDPTKCPPGVIRPVCGSNGVTYDNICYLKAARCINPDIQFLVPGKCPPKMTSCGLNKCTTTKSKVCATLDGSSLKYQNSCFLTAATCLNPKIKPATCSSKLLRHLGLTLPVTVPVTAPPKAASTGKPTLPAFTPGPTTAAAASSSSGSGADADLADDLGSLVLSVDLSDTESDVLITDDLTDSTTISTSSASNDTSATTTTSASSTNGTTISASTDMPTAKQNSTKSSAYTTSTLVSMTLSVVLVAAF